MFYDPAPGKLQVWRDGVLLGSWTDPTPLTTGAYLALRTDGSNVLFDDIQITRESKYYYAGSQRVAVRHNGSAQVNYLLGDHLGSTALTTNQAGGTVTTTVNLHFRGGASIGRPNSLEQILDMMLDMGFRINMLQVGSFAYELFAFWREYDERARSELGIAYDKQQLSFVAGDNHSYIVSTVKIGWSWSDVGQPEQASILFEAGSPTTMFTQKEHDPERHAQRFLEVGKRLYGLVRPTFGWIERCKPSGYTTWKDIENLVVPHIYWANFLGPAYVAKLGRDFLLKAPGWRTESLIDNGILYVLSPSLVGGDQKSTVEQVRQYFGNVTVRHKK